MLVSGEDRKVRAGKSYTRDVHMLSISFLLIFLAFGAAQNLETTINKVALHLQFFLVLLLFFFFFLENQLKESYKL